LTNQKKTVLRSEFPPHSPFTQFPSPIYIGEGIGKPRTRATRAHALVLALQIIVPHGGQKAVSGKGNAKKQQFKTTKKYD
jgi:hypothetical protein